MGRNAVVLIIIIFATLLGLAACGGGAHVSVHTETGEEGGGDAGGDDGDTETESLAYPDAARGSGLSEVTSSEQYQAMFQTNALMFIGNSKGASYAMSDPYLSFVQSWLVQDIVRDEVMQ